MKFSEEMVTLFNPCPSISKAELCVMDDAYPKLMPTPVDDDRPVFSIEFRWSTGNEQDFLTLNPGQERSCPQQLARQIIREVGHRGIVMIPPPAAGVDARAWRARQIAQGLRAALTHYEQEGIIRLHKLRRSKSLGTEEMEQLVNQHRSYYLNQRKHDLLKGVADRANKEYAASLKKVAA
jgi:hypothetical protein